MSKLRRKLQGYLTREKKAPNRRVKFCPLSPCKRSKTPLFQLDKHLQSDIHNLKPKTSAYVMALAQAPRASLSNVNSYLKRQRNQRANQRSNQIREAANEKLMRGMMHAMKLTILASKMFNAAQKTMTCTVIRILKN